MASTAAESTLFGHPQTPCSERTTASIPFTSNYTDLSNQRGYQFQFFCRKCGNGYMSTFQANTLSGIANAANVAASIFGGIFGRAAQSAAALQSQVAGPQHDSALDAAVREISPIFKQCTRCGSWVCEPVCRNKKAGLCETCAPDMDEEIAAAQAQAAREQAMNKARTVDYLGQRNLEQVVSALCPSCGAKTQGGKFCPECGTSLAQKRTCANCGAEADGSPKFCPECITMPDVYEGAVLAPEIRPAELQLYDTHLAIVPEDDDPWPIPLGALTSIREESEPPGIALVTPEGLTRIGRLGRQRDACRAAIIERRGAQRHMLAELTGEAGFSDGWGLRATEVRDFTGLLHQFAAPERVSCANTLVAAATADPRIGFVQLLVDNPHRLALRKLEPLKRLRAAIVARVIHNERWTGATREALRLASVSVSA